MDDSYHLKCEMRCDLLTRTEVVIPVIVSQKAIHWTSPSQTIPHSDFGQQLICHENRDLGNHATIVILCPFAGKWK
jgi:hypothetical protein